ncbi:hypothetical protein [Planobispora longispora]|uniref:Uncharacterized protein n=1 Tax=Planobispora longispora TaxID=28887 RepID=A0A8J3W4V3_9ACTN|nr:hypothetical protein [Planobispora longispora]GIH76172.1 hypothetical protein Plo01_26010 [Planobispora longispora]
MSAVPFDQALTEAAQIFADARRRRDSLTPEQAAAEAYVPGGRSVEELTELIRAQRAEARAERLAAEARQLATSA